MHDGARLTLRNDAAIEMNSPAQGVTSDDVASIPKDSLAQLLDAGAFDTTWIQRDISAFAQVQKISRNEHSGVVGGSACSPSRRSRVRLPAIPDGIS